MALSPLAFTPWMMNNKHTDWVVLTFYFFHVTHRLALDLPHTVVRGMGGQKTKKIPIPESGRGIISFVLDTTHLVKTSNKYCIVLLPFRLLHVGHSSCKFSSISGPPLDLGRMWSTSKRSISNSRPLPSLPQGAAHFPPCFQYSISLILRERLSYKSSRRANSAINSASATTLPSTVALPRPLHTLRRLCPTSTSSRN